MTRICSMAMLTAGLTAVVWGAGSCSDTTMATGTDADTDTDLDADMDTDMDTDADSDSDTDTWTDTDTGTGTGTGDGPDGGDWTCEFECHGAAWCTNHSGVVHDDMTCPNDQVCCEVIE